MPGGNPLIRNAIFYRLTYGDLRHHMPFASDMQFYEASERLTSALNTLFEVEARRLAFEYEEHDRRARDNARRDSSSA